MDLVRLAGDEASYTKLFRLFGWLTDWAADFGSLVENGMWTEQGHSSPRWFKSSEFGFRVHLLILGCIDAPSCQVTVKDLRLSSPPTCRDRSFPASSKKRARRIEKKCRLLSWVQVPGQSTWIRGGCSVSILEVFINQGLDGFKTAKSRQLPGMRGRGAPPFPIRVARCTPVILSVGLDLLQYFFTFVIALTDVKKSIQPS